MLLWDKLFELQKEIALLDVSNHASLNQLKEIVDITTLRKGIDKINEDHSDKTGAILKEISDLLATVQHD